MNKNIKRRYHIDIDLGADTLEDLIASLKHIIFDLSRHKENNTFKNDKINHPSISGSPSAGYHYNLYFDPEMDHEKYFKVIEAGAHMLEDV